MDEIVDHAIAAARMKALLADEDVQQPDRIERHPGEIRLIWDEPRVVVVIELPGDSS